MWGVKEIDCYGEQLGIGEAIKINEDNIDLESLEEKGRVIFLSNDYFGEVYEYEIHLGCIYETESEAQHYAKYGNITRIEKMPVPPTWEEFCEDYSDVWVVNPNTQENIFVAIDNETENYIQVILDKEIVYSEVLTKVNYIKALDKMVELWKEEV